MSLWTRGILMLGVAAPLAYQSAAAQAGGARRDSGSVTLVPAPTADRPLAWRVTRQSVIGAANAGEVLPRLAPGVGVAALSDGRIVAIDRDNAKVVFFNADGTLLRSVGGRGGGPGEYQILGGIATVHNTVLVYDVAAPHITVLASDGRYLRTRPLPVRPWDRFAFADGRFIAVVTNSVANQLELRLVAIARDTTELAAQRQALRPVELPGCATTLPMAPYLVPPLAWAVSGGTVAVSHAAPYSIAVFRNARLAMRITRALPARRPTADDIRREAGDGMTMRGGGGCRVPPEPLIRARGAADVAPSIVDLTFDPDGRLWVRRWSPRGTPAAIDVYRADGSYEGTLPAGTAFPAFFTARDRFVSVETDADGVETLAIFGVSR